MLGKENWGERRKEEWGEGGEKKREAKKRSDHYKQPALGEGGEEQER